MLFRTVIQSSYLSLGRQACYQLSYATFLFISCTYYKLDVLIDPKVTTLNRFNSQQINIIFYSAAQKIKMDILNGIEVRFSNGVEIKSNEETLDGLVYLLSICGLY
jgi:hypothetical protein